MSWNGHRNGHRKDLGLVAALALASTLHQNKTVILAGGKGRRLRPYTAVLPKPLMPLGERAILEFVLHQHAEQGLVEVTLSVGHLAHLIEAVFGNGDNYGVEMTYVREEMLLGTAGPLRLVEGLEKTFLVLNGDVVTTLDYRNLIRSHRASGNVLTIATKKRETKKGYGVLSLEPGDEPVRRIVGYQEKPVVETTVTMGIYALEPQALEFIPEGGYFDFPELVQALIRAGAPVGSFVYDCLWLDIGRHDDYEQAVALWESGGFARSSTTATARPKAIVRPLRAPRGSSAARSESATQQLAVRAVETLVGLTGMRAVPLVTPLLI